jgi:uncharacterized protein
MNVDEWRGGAGEGRAGGTDVERTIETVALFGSLLATLLVLFIPITVGIALVQRWVGPARLQRWLGGRNLVVALAKGTLLGAITPFCGCSTIPLLVGLLKANVRFAAVAAFMLASPLLNPYILGVIALLFGGRTAVTYALVAVGATVLIAALWEGLRLDRHLKIPGYAPVGAGRLVGEGGQRRALVSAASSSVTSVTTPSVAPSVSAGCGSADPATCGGSSTSTCDGSDGPTGGGTTEPWLGLRSEVVAAWHGALGLLRPMAVPLVAGVTVGAVIYGAVPEGAFASLLGATTWYTLPLAAVLGLPLYLRGETAFPIGAALLSAGVGAGPMFAMVIAGMGASIPEVTMLSGLFDRKLLVVFLVSIFGMAVAGGAVIPASM